MTRSPRRALGPLWLCVAALACAACDRSEPPARGPDAAAVPPTGFTPTAEVVVDGGRNLAWTGEAASVPAPLAAHAHGMAQRIYRVAGRVYLAVGWDLANVTMVEGDDGLVIVDPLGSVEAMRTVMAEFRKITAKPVRAVVYTHSHPDHIQGVRAVVGEEDVRSGRVEIIAHDTLVEGVLATAGLVAPILGVRSAYSFGLFLDPGPEGAVNEGIGPVLQPGRTTFLAPTRTFAHDLDLEVAGVRMHLRHAPSETDDEIVVWLPDLRVLQSAEVVQGECFPNLHTIRGTRYRDPVQWFRTIDMLRRDFPAEHLVPSHGRPVSGRDEITALLTAYRDAIQYVHDQTVRYMNQGLGPDELVEAVRLPPHLAGHPWLGECYGTVAHAVRQIYVGYLGWFEGDPTFLDPLPPSERARRYVEQMGGTGAVLAAARLALDAGDERWAAELVTHVLGVDRENAEARTLKARALRRLGFRAASTNWRNFYLTAALELEGTKDLGAALERIVAGGGGSASPDILAALPIGRLLQALTVRLDAAKSLDTHMTLGIELTDVPERYALEIRRGVAELHDRLPERCDVVLRTDAPTLHSLFLRQESFLRAFLTGHASVTTGSRDDLRRFFDHFDLALHLDAPLAR